MRNLIYVPIIHSNADMGSLAKELNQKGIAEFGSEFWQNHTETINGFWEAIDHYFETIDIYIKDAKIYQDGMVADGEMAKVIIDEAVKSGSKNYEIVAELLRKGAVIIQTENLDLVRRELRSLQNVTQAKSTFRKILKLIGYKIIKGILLKKRDKYIAARIAETLKQDETGIIFIGAYHNLLDKLPEDINVIEIKEVAKVREYHRLIPLHNRYKERFSELAQYLVKK